MTDTSAPTPTPPPAPSPGAPPPPAPPAWHNGVEADTLGFWQNKGLDLTDPVKFATGLTKQYRDAEKFIGAPPDQLLRMPKADAKPDELKAFYQRLGAPADPKEYDFSAVKFNGEPLEEGFVATMRDALAQAYVPKEKASTITAAVVKYLEEAEKQEGTVNAGKLAEEKAKLAENWKTNFEYNRLKAMEGARRLGLTPDAVNALEGQIGYSAVMEAMRKIGASTTEDTFVERGVGGANGVVTTREGAQSRLNELMADAAWGKRVTSGEAAAVSEWRSLLTMIDGEAA